jgi:hypothetical protein
MPLRGVAVLMVSIWLAVNLLGSLASDDANPHIASSVVAASFDTPDDLKHPSFCFPLPIAVNTTYNADWLLNCHLILSVSTKDFNSHRVSSVRLL